MSNRSATRKTVTALLVVSFTIAVIWTLQRPVIPSETLEFSLIDQPARSLADLQGQPLLVHFWSTTCGPCLQEIPHLKTLYRDLAPEGFEMVAVAVPTDRPDHVARLRRAQSLNYPVALDISGTVNRAFSGVPGTPYFVLIDSRGQIVKRHLGPWPETDLRNRIKALLATGESADALA
ncbi:MAG: TlpA family protein disulfide reductase [Gammaproteobacteria bacterium]|nr:TlpA family protein disulfide reductase [Gammaproteobacteria bacterium]